MSRSSIIAAAFIATATVGTALADHSTPLCGGDMTIERLSDASCSHRIPTPTWRDDALAAAAVPAEPVEAPVYVKAPSIDGSNRMVRLVGTRFLQPTDEAIDFRARSAEHAAFVDRFLFAAASYLGLTGETRIASTGADGRQIAEATAEEGRETVGLRATF